MIREKAIAKLVRGMPDNTMIDAGSVGWVIAIRLPHDPGTYGYVEAECENKQQRTE